MCVHVYVCVHVYLHVLALFKYLVWLANATQIGMYHQFYCYLKTLIICKSAFHKSAVGCVSVFSIVFCFLLYNNYSTLSIIILL